MQFPRLRPMQYAAIAFLLIAFVVGLKSGLQKGQGEDQKALRYVERYKQPQDKKLDILWIGDSITSMWKTDGLTVWNKEFAKLNCALFAVPGDTTEDTIRRLGWCDLENINAKVTVLLIGTNDLTDKKNSPESIAAQIKKIVEIVRLNVPKTQIILMGLLPRHQTLSDPIGKRVDKVNQLLASMDDGSNIHYLNINDELLNDKGEISDEKMSYFLHLTRDGYVVWAKKLHPLIDEALK